MEPQLTLSEIWLTAQFHLVAIIIFILGFVSGLYWHNILIKPDHIESSVYAKTDIEHLTHCNRYFPRVGGKYLYWWPSKQLFTLISSSTSSIYTDSLEGAELILKQYMEQERMVKTEIIKPKM